MDIRDAFGEHYEPVVQTKSRDLNQDYKYVIHALAQQQKGSRER